MPKKRSLFPEEEEEIRKNTNPFEKEDEEGGVDLKDPDSPRNSFLDEEDLDLESDWDDPEEKIGDTLGMDHLF